MYRFDHGASLVVAAEEYQPHTALTPGKPGLPLSFTGPMVNLLHTMATSLNFTYTFVRPPDGSWGTMRPDGSWSGMVGLVKEEKADIGLGPFGMSAMRAEVVDYTRIILIDYLRILAGRGRPEVDPWGFLLPLAPLVWAAMLTVLMLLLALVFLLYKCYTLEADATRRGSRDFFFKYFRVLLQQDTLASVVYWWWDRFVLMMWMILMLVLSRSFSGNLMALLAVRYIPQPFQTLRDVIDSSVTMIWEADTVYIQYINVCNESVCWCIIAIS
ncbi:glutamate receptor ionotropic, delta-2-like [Procambarus clarkii]|uniref:glutamate receptor ionotropic, delta-2-like n=1 Tax=Procambarus clarkii TaxID=6728 RepID=UPI0037443F53